jgi:hypothetical protein
MAVGGTEAAFAFEGTEVAAGAAVACGADFGVVPPLDSGVAVAEDPQANNKTTNNRIIAFGRCLMTLGLSDDCGTYLLPFVYDE